MYPNVVDLGDIMRAVGTTALFVEMICLYGPKKSELNS